MGIQVDFAVGIELSQIGVLEDLAVDRYRHALFDLAAEAGETAIEFENHPPKGVRLHLKLRQPAGEPAGCLAREVDPRHDQPSRTPTEIASSLCSSQ